ncbi:Shiga toxin A subunit [Pseudescherichia sp.]|uniref:Shiga toxin A subunit n=1 Tax=Pseudescherichia sp. TaxID=2055881 RepID=UPI002898CB97|nr:Shiga toxin A subunit [Pseudescherichia sp.]
MNKLIYIALFFPALSYADDKACANIWASIETGLFQHFTEELNIVPSSIDRDKTVVEVLDISPVSRLFATQIAYEDHNADEALNNGLTLSKSQYFSSYYENKVKNVTAKYTYQNKKGIKNVFIASGLINADECSVRFNGYLTLSREF